MKPLLLAGRGDAGTRLAAGRRHDDVEALLVPTLPDVHELDLDRPHVVLLDRRLLRSVPDGEARLRRLAEVAAIVACGEPGEHEPGADLPLELLAAFLPADASPRAASLLLGGAMRHALALRAERLARDEAERRRRELRELTDVGVALASRRDLLPLLELILTHARRLTASDAGSLYLVEPLDAPDDATPRVLRFKLSQNFSRPSLALGEFTLPIDGQSLAGWAAASGEVVAVPDVYALGGQEAFRQNRSFDERLGYRTKSVLVIPLRTHRGATVGVLQLINRKRSPTALLGDAADVEREVLPFDRRSIELVGALAAQAAVAIENGALAESIERLFEGFVTAAVTAIESRDPATFGHSARVAALAIGLAEALPTHGRGRWTGARLADDELRALRYAALLHDFGKVSVPEEVLVKATKLYPADVERIRQRVGAARLAAHLAYERARADAAMAGEAGDATSARLVAERDARLAELDALMRAVELANDPVADPATTADLLERLAHAHYVDADGARVPLVTEHERRLLGIVQGTLDDAERAAFQAHVVHTERFLSLIPWTHELRAVPVIAHAHHEKLDGSGYPRGLRGDEIPLAARILTLADIYDALTATDRAYKRPLPRERALAILREEAARGELDADLVETFDAARVWALTEPRRA